MQVKERYESSARTTRYADEGDEMQVSRDWFDTHRLGRWKSDPPGPLPIFMSYVNIRDGARGSSACDDGLSLHLL